MCAKKPGFQVVKDEEVCVENINDILFAGDVGCTTFDEEGRKVLGEILKNKCDLFIILGDLARKGVEEEFNKVISFCDERVKIPIFTLRGNHDLPDYNKFFGKPTYALILESIVFIFIDNVTDPAKVPEEDLEFLKKELAKHSESKRFVILFHIPPPTNISSLHMSEEKWHSLKQALDEYQDKIECIICGHIHGFQEYFLDGYHIYISGGGGAKLHNVGKNALKKHHALKMDLARKSIANIQVIPVE